MGTLAAVLQLTGFPGAQPALLDQQLRERNVVDPKVRARIVNQVFLAAGQGAPALEQA
jgi:hypothetical protein